MSVIVFTAFNNLFIFFYYSILYKAALRSRMSELGIVQSAAVRVQTESLLIQLLQSAL